jgi:hypothetical protein
MSTQPQLVCIACEACVVGVYELLCPACRQTAEQLGLVKPELPSAEAPDQRTQIGPTDV